MPVQVPPPAACAQKVTRGDTRSTGDKDAHLGRARVQLLMTGCEEQGDVDRRDLSAQDRTRVDGHGGPPGRGGGRRASDMGHDGPGWALDKGKGARARWTWMGAFLAVGSATEPGREQRGWGVSRTTP